jgi:hypothetical protein
MSATGYRVTAALVVAKDQTGRNHHVYHGAFIPWLNDEQRAHFLRHKLVEEVTGTEAKEIAPEAVTKPAKTAPEAKWVDYGVALGHSRAELEALSKQDLVELLG